MATIAGGATAKLSPVSDNPSHPGAGQPPSTPPPSTPPPPPGATPPPPPPPGLQAPAGYVGFDAHATPVGPIARVTGLSKAIAILTAVVAAATVATTLLTLGVTGDASDFLAGEASEDDFRDALAPLNSVQALAGVATLATGILTIIWMYRIARNVRSFGRQTTWHPLFSIFGWFLPPFFLYVIPLLVLREQWKASDPTADDDTESWRRSPDTPLLWGWFVFYGLAPFVFFLAQIGSVAGAGVGTGDIESVAESLDDVGALTLLSAVSIVGAAVCWILFVRQLTRRHAALTNER